MHATAQEQRDQFQVASAYVPLMRIAGLDADEVFRNPSIKVWRRLPDRENCTLDFESGGGGPVRWHIKRFLATEGVIPGPEEAKAHDLLVAEGIPTANLVGWGQLADRRSFIIFEDLAGYRPADKLIEGGFSFTRLSSATADLAARLHTSGLHHRDLYLCHFMVKPLDDESVDVRLIDTARVRRLGGMFTRSRWIVKDVAQFWYSTLRLAITDEQRLSWLERYGQSRGLPGVGTLRSAVRRKVREIGRHDRKINLRRPERNVSIPERA